MGPRLSWLTAVPAAGDMDRRSQHVAGQVVISLGEGRGGGPPGGRHCRCVLQTRRCSLRKPFQGAGTAEADAQRRGFAGTRGGCPSCRGNLEKNSIFRLNFEYVIHLHTSSKLKVHTSVPGKLLHPPTLPPPRPHSYQFPGSPSRAPFTSQ